MKYFMEPLMKQEAKTKQLMSCLIMNTENDEEIIPMAHMRSHQAITDILTNVSIFIFLVIYKI